jgi:hypothetical protein
VQILENANWRFETSNNNVCRYEKIASNGGGKKVLINQFILSLVITEIFYCHGKKYSVSADKFNCLSPIRNIRHLFKEIL